MTKFKEIKEKEVLCETQFYTVVKKQGNKIQLQNEAGENIVVDDKYLESCLISASQATKTEKVTRTEIATIFTNNPNIVMTVNYNKQVDVKEAAQDIHKVTSTKTVSVKDLEKLVASALKGEERTMVGRHHGSFTELGRMNFIDMEQSKGTTGYDARLRQVDPRTINWLIVNNVKYIIK